MKLLLVEDDPITSLILKGTLGSLGHDVVIAQNGQAAWTILATEPIRTVISDWAMPVMDGLELCRRIRSELSRYVYFILLTNLSATEENEETALTAGVDDFLSKPGSLRELRSRLHVAHRILDCTERIQALESLIPICSYCKNIRDDKNYWQKIEAYIGQRTGSRFSHSVCPTCFENHILPTLAKLDAGSQPAHQPKKPRVQ